MIKSVPCPLGRFSPATGIGACVACSAVRIGTMTTSIGSTTCVACTPGRFVEDAFSQSTCVDCAPGRASEASRTACTRCETGRVAVGRGNAKCESCIAGTFVDVATATAGGDVGNATCAPCAINTYAQTDEAIVCAECDAGDSTRNLVGQTYCIRDTMVCPVGTYLGWRTATSCTGCPSEGTICKDSILTIMPNWWFAPLVDTADGARRMLDFNVPLWPCLNEECCLANAEVVSEPGKGDVVYHTVKCKEGYYGPLCGACNVEKNYLRSGQACKECWHFVLTYMATAGIIGGLILWLFWVVAFQDFGTEKGDHTGIVFKILMSFCQMLTVLGIFKARGTALFNSLLRQPAQIIGGSLTAALPLKCILKSQLYGSFVVNIFTLPGMALVTMIIIAPVWLGKVVYSRYTAGTPLPAAPTTKRTVCCCRTRLTTVWERQIWTNTQMKGREGHWQPISRLQAVIVFVLFSIYPTLVKSVFSIVRCTGDIHGKRYLDEDLSVQCWVGFHPSFVVAAAVACVVYLIGSPVAVVLLLHWNRNRLDEEQFRTTFSFLYNGYSTERGSIVVGWEAIVMVRKFAITVIPVVSGDPYIQVLLALVLLVFSFGLQEHFHPFETELLNRLESAGLFTLIFTQIMSILYLYIDTYAAELGEQNVWFEAGVTLVLMLANGTILTMMVGGIVFSYFQRREMHARRRRAFEEQFINGSWGGLSAFRNPRIEPELQLRVRADRNFRVLADADATGDLTGEVVTKGSTVLVLPGQIVKAYVRIGCRPGHRVNYMRRVDGRGWIVDPDPRTGTRIFEVVGRTVSSEGGMERARVWRYIPVAVSVPIQATASSWPYAVLTGEVLERGRSVVVDMRIERHTLFARCRCRRWVTFLRLADHRGWVMEPSRMPLDGEEHTNAEVVQLVHIEDQIRSSTERKHICEYVVTQAQELWRDTKLNAELSPSGETLAAEQPFLVSERRLLRSVSQSTVALRPADARDERHGDSVSAHDRPDTHPLSCVKRCTLTFLKLADGRGWVLANNPVSGAPVVRFRGVRKDSLDFQGLPTLRLRYRVLTPASIAVLSEPLPKAAAVAILAPGSVILVSDRAEVVRPFHTFVFLRISSGRRGQDAKVKPAVCADGQEDTLHRRRSFDAPLVSGWIDVTQLRVTPPLLKPRGPNRRKKKAKGSVGALQLLSSQLGEEPGAPSFVSTGRRWVFLVPPNPEAGEDASAAGAAAKSNAVSELSGDAAEESESDASAKPATNARWWGIPIAAPDVDANGDPFVELDPPAPLTPGSVVIASRRIVRSYFVHTSQGDMVVGQQRAHGTFIEIERVLPDKAAFTRWVGRMTSSFMAHDNSFGADPAEEAALGVAADAAVDEFEAMQTATGGTLKRARSLNPLMRSLSRRSGGIEAAVTATNAMPGEQQHFGKWLLTNELTPQGSRAAHTKPPLLEFLQTFEPPFVIDSRERDKRLVMEEQRESHAREEHDQASAAAAAAHKAAVAERKARSEGGSENK